MEEVSHRPQFHDILGEERDGSGDVDEFRKEYLRSNSFQYGSRTNCQQLNYRYSKRIMNCADGKKSCIA